MGLWKAKGGEVMTGYAAGGELILMVFPDMGYERGTYSVLPGEARKMAAEILACTADGLPTHDELLALVGEEKIDDSGEGS